MSDSFSFKETAAATQYALQNKSNWAKNLLLAGAQAAANIKIVERQKEQYEDISKDRVKLINAALGDYTDRINALLPDFPNAYPDVPQAAEYVPIDPCAEQLGLIECNIGKTSKAHSWASVVSRYQAQTAYTRLVVLDPRWYTNMEMFALTVGQLLRGEIPQGDMMEVMTESAEVSLATGRMGGNGRSLRRSLMVKRLQIQQAGRDALKSEAGLMARVSPTSKMASAADMMTTPAQRISLALTQAQLVQNSLQNLFNANAQKPPYKLAQLNLRLEAAINRLQYAASKASMVNSFVPNYAAILQPQINALSSTVSENNFRPYAPQTGADDPQFGGSFLAQSGANPFTADLKDISSGHKASDRPLF